MNVFIIMATLILVAHVASADTIKLKSGKVIKGKVIDKSDGEVKVDTGIGIVTTYYSDEIESIEKDKTETAPAGQPEMDQPEIVEFKERTPVVFETAEQPEHVVDAKNKFYDTGELMSEGSSLEGHYRYYYKSGQIALETFNKDGKPWQGRHVRFFEDGTIQIEQVYEEGVLLDDEGEPYSGTVEIYDENGNILEESTYEDGIQQE